MDHLLTHARRVRLFSSVVSYMAIPLYLHVPVSHLGWHILIVHSIENNTIRKVAVGVVAPDRMRLHSFLARVLGRDDGLVDVARAANERVVIDKVMEL